MVDISREIENRVLSTFGVAGKKWLDELPSIINEVYNKWNISIDPPLKDFSYSYIFPAKKDDNEMILKLSVPNQGLYYEIEALSSFNGRGSVNLVDADPELGAILLERLYPGEVILTLNNDEMATSIAGQIMSQLHSDNPETGPFPNISDWSNGLKKLRTAFNGITGPFPVSLVERAECLSSELINSMEQTTLLHGDLHHWNILSSQRAPWLAIDPKGVIGEPAYETGAWLRNPFPDILQWDNPGKVLIRRIDQFTTEFGFDRERIIGWGMYQAVLAGWWSFEENDPDWEKWISIAEIIHSIS